MTPRQRDIYEMLQGQRLSVSDLMQMTGKDRSTLASHVRALYKDGMIWREQRDEMKSGKSYNVTYYSAKSKKRGIEDKPWCVHRSAVEQWRWMG